MKKILTFMTRSALETKKAGKTLANYLKAGDVVALHGPLGAGKTTLVKGIAVSLGVHSEKQVSSPTYVLIHEYQGRKKIYHLDWYRLKTVKDSDAEFAAECFESDGITLIEWPERGKGLLPKRTVTVHMTHQGPTTRRIRIALPAKQ